MSGSQELVEAVIRTYEGEGLRQIFEATGVDQANEKYGKEGNVALKHFREEFLSKWKTLYDILNPVIGVSCALDDIEVDYAVNSASFRSGKVVRYGDFNRKRERGDLIIYLSMARHNPIPVGLIFYPPFIHEGKKLDMLLGNRMRLELEKAALQLLIENNPHYS